VAVQETLRAMLKQAPGVAETIGRYQTGHPQGRRLGDQRVGVIWYTQVSNKSLTMVLSAEVTIREVAMENPTLVVLTDRNDLDN
jgi:type I restriction enzyme R subunit